MSRTENTTSHKAALMTRAVLVLLLLCGLAGGTKAARAADELGPFENGTATQNWIDVDSPAEHSSQLGRSCQPCRSSSNGTLFQWSSAPNAVGGPNLDEPLVTDRPDFTEATSTVGLGVSQIEFGYTYTYDNSSDTGTRTQSFGEPLLRYGIFADWLEFRLALFPTEQQTTIGTVSNSTSSMADMYLGFKIALTPQAGILPEMALIPQMTVLTGGQAFSANQTLPGVNWVYSWALSDTLATAGSTQINRSVDDGTGSTYNEIAQSWTVAASLSDQLGAYTEWFALIPSGADTNLTQHYANGGFTYLISNDVQFDIRAGVGLNAAADDYFIGSGLSIRFQ
jgi:hypothetical protein